MTSLKVMIIFLNETESARMYYIQHYTETGKYNCVTLSFPVLLLLPACLKVDRSQTHLENTELDIYNC